jgi:thiol-disulfide isomerase/thioredoxin
MSERRFRPALTVVSWAIALVSALDRAASAAEPPAPVRQGTVLQLTSGAFLSGKVHDSEGPGTLCWTSPSFLEPLTFDLGMVQGVQFLLQAEPPRPAGDARFELTGGDVLFGSLVEIDDRDVVLDSAQLGRVHVARSRIRRIERFRDGAQPVYVGPNGLTDWRESTPAGAWCEGPLGLATDQAKATLRGDLGLPARAVVEFAITWQTKPDFTLALGGGVGWDGNEAKELKGYRFEVWGDDLTALRETDDKLALASVAKVSPGPGRVHLRVYLDQGTGRLLVTTPDGAVRADLKLAETAPRSLGGVTLTNIRGDLRLERLRIERWGGQAPDPAWVDQPHIQKADGTLVFGEVARFDPAAREFAVRQEQDETRIAESEVALISVAAEDRGPEAGICVVTRDGIRLSGELLKVEKNEVWLSVAGVKEFARLPVAALRSLIVLRHDALPHAKGDGEKTAVLELGDLRLPGRLVDGRAEPGASCLLWQPQGSATASHLRNDVSGKIVFREPTPDRAAAARIADPPAQELALAAERARIQAQVQARALAPARVEQAQAGRVIVQQPDGTLVVKILPPQPQPQAQADPAQARAQAEAKLALARAQAAALQAQARAQMQQAVRVIVQQPNGNLVMTTQPLPARVAPPPAKPSLHLRSGDVIPAEVTRIDDEGVWFKSPRSEKTFVAHSLVTAVELAPEAPDAFRVSKSKRERLLVVPRMQKEAPPTHLVRSRDGDYLRGRVVALDEKTLQVEIRLETKEVPRDRISRIIWLHGDEREAPEEKGPPQPAGDEPSAALRVQALQRNGDRLTFAAEQVAETALTGRSEALGTCRVALGEIDQLLLGGAIEQAASQLTYQQWTLHNAPDPRAFQDEATPGAPGRTPGTEAALVGKAAPDFELELLGGARFRLADAKAKGQVVLLDFWASWCGPCIQAMPQVERVAEEFRDRGVQLVAVNLQESPERITAMLERHDLHPAVALDRNGKVAEQYGATAIPQTVIIGRDGTVARLFVGGGPRLGDQLREALKAVLTGGEANPVGR